MIGLGLLDLLGLIELEINNNIIALMRCCGLIINQNPAPRNSFIGFGVDSCCANPVSSQGTAKGFRYTSKA